MNRTVKALEPQLRIFLANQAIALGWILRNSCKACAQRLFACARWLVPEAERFLVQRIGSHNQYRRLSKFAPALSSFLYRIQSFRVVAGFLVVLVLLGSLDFVTRVTVRKSPEVRPSLQTAPVSGTQFETVPVPTRKPQVVSKIPKKKAGNQSLKIRMAQRKSLKR
jgi:hypothetical protein